MTGRKLLTYKDISKLTGITPGALRKRLATGKMPQPDLRHGASPVWYANTLRKWLTDAKPGGR